MEYTSLAQLLGTMALDDVDDDVVEVRGTQTNPPHPRHRHQLTVDDQNPEHNLPTVLVDYARHGGAEEVAVRRIQRQHSESGEEDDGVLVEALYARIHPFVDAVKVASDVEVI